jgi:hypothetical protein
MATMDPKIAALIARAKAAEAQTPAWKMELMRLLKTPNLTDAQVARLIELRQRHAAESKARQSGDK